MAILGAKQKVLVNGVDLSSFFNNKDSTRTVKELDTTTFGAVADTHAVGLQSAKVNLTGLWDSVVAATSPDPVLNGVFASPTDMNVLLAPNGLALGNRCEALQATIGTYKVGAPVNGIETITTDFTADGGLDPGYALHDLVAETATGNATSLDNTAGTANGGVGMLQCTLASGTTPSDTRVIAHSADNTTFAALVTFTAVTASNASQRVLVAAATTVNRYLREQRTISGTTPSFTTAVTFSRR